MQGKPSSWEHGIAASFEKDFSDGFRWHWHVFEIVTW
jgi:hypothetical protein